MSVLIWAVAACGTTAGVGGIAMSALGWRLSRQLTDEEVEAMRRAHWAHTREHYPDVYWTDEPTPIDG